MTLYLLFLTLKDFEGHGGEIKAYSEGLDKGAKFAIK
jgi:hypothetical protein